MLNVILVFVGGGLGCLSRYGISRLVTGPNGQTFPWATLISNTASAIVMGIALGFFASRIQNESIRNFLIVGFCGGFSTFSTFSFETLDLVRKGNFLFAAGNIIVSITMCLVVLAVLIRKA